MYKIILSDVASDKFKSMPRNDAAVILSWIKRDLVTSENPRLLGDNENSKFTVYNIGCYSLYAVCDDDAKNILVLDVKSEIEDTTSNFEVGPPDTPRKTNKTRRIGLINHKGGVSKTTSVINIAYSLAKKGYKVLCVDGDPQASLTYFFGIKEKDMEPSLDGSVKYWTLGDIMSEQIKLNEKMLEADEDAINDIEELDVSPELVKVSLSDKKQETREDGTTRLVPCVTELWLIPANDRLETLKDGLNNYAMRDQLLVKALASLDQYFDFVLVDSAPSRDMLTNCILSYVKELIIPIKASGFSSEGIKKLIKKVREVKLTSNPALKIHSILITMAKQNTQILRTFKEEFEEISKTNKSLILSKAIIPDSVTWEAAVVSHQPMGVFDRNHPIAKQYEVLADEIIDREV